MSVHDPLLKKLKDIIIQFSKVDNYQVSDYDLFLAPFCQTLEEILRQGLKSTKSFGLHKCDYWDWIVELVNRQQYYGVAFPVSFAMSIESITNNRKINTSQGHGRLFLRTALQQRTLLLPIKELCKKEMLVNTHYNTTFSIIGNDILSEIFMSLLMQVNQINFHLCLHNCAFLDDNWSLPVYKEYEFVPCMDIGIKVYHFYGRALIIEVQPDSVAGEDKKIEAGDILDEICGEVIRNIKKGFIRKKIKSNYGLPIRIGIIKAVLPSGHIYPPISSLLQSAGFDPLAVVVQQTAGIAGGPRSGNTSTPASPADWKPPPHAQLPEDLMDEVPVHNSSDAATYNLVYFGSVPCGDTGGMEQVEGAIKTACEYDTSQYRQVVLSLGEKDVVIEDAKTKEVLVSHAYPEVSSCGRRLCQKLVFTYIAGETTCNLAKEFTAFVFEGVNEVEVKQMLCAIAQGFERTHWAV